MEETKTMAEGTAGRVTARAVELAIMFGVAPSVLAAFMQGWMVFPAIWTLAAVCLVMLLCDRTFDRRQLWNWGGVRKGMAIMGMCFAVGAPAMAAALLLFEPERVLSLPRERPRVWAVIMVGYPVLSVYAQELAFRAFFFHRYSLVFKRKWGMVAASALAFGYAHIIMHNWIAVAFTTVGGVLFAYTYWRTRSMAAVCIEHALYGCYIFTIGWGWYFYGGAIGR